MKSRLPGFETSIFAVMTPLAKQYNAINLSQGFPDFDADPALIELISKYFNSNYNSYAPMPGVFKLRQRVVEKYHSLHGFLYDAEKEITITAGASQAIYCAITAAIHPGDEVIVLEPVFDTYVPSIRLCGAKAVSVQMKSPLFKPNWDEVEAAINSKTKMIIINSPHNPSGSMLNHDDILSLEKIIKKYDLYVLSDEVHEHIYFETEHLSVCRYEELRKRAFLLSSFGKTFHGTGWKMGYCLAPEKLMNEFRKIHQNVVFAVNHPIQHALAEYMGKPDVYLQLPDFFRKKRDLFLEGIKNSRFKFIPSQGTFFQLLDYSEISEENDVDFAIRLTKELGIATIPLSPFYENKSNQRVLRICFAKTEELIHKATKILCKI